jgi:SAM-dependent methyltransferase
VAAVGLTGHVLATDLDLGSLPGSQGTLAVRRHDVVRDPTPAEAFDLIHARLLLVHLPERDAVLRSLVSALRPGGWLVIEDADPGLQPLACIDPTTRAEHRSNEIRHGFRSLLASRGADLAFGRTLSRRLREAGLDEVRADAFFSLRHPACVELELLTLDLVADQLLDAGIVDPADLAAHRLAVMAGEMDLVQPPLISAWGRRPLDEE